MILNEGTPLKRTTLLLGLSVAGGIAVGVSGTKILNAQQAPVKRTALLKTDLAGMKGKEGLVVSVEHAPGVASGKHSYPWHECVSVLEGALSMEEQGKPPVALKAGDAFYLAPRQVHDGKNASETAPLKVLVFVVAEKGQPFIVPVK